MAEDLGSGDVTAPVLAGDLVAEWRIEAQAEGVLAGVGVAQWLLGGEVRLRDGAWVEDGSVVASGRTSARKALAAERTALNFIMLLSGVATLTHEFVQTVEGTGARIVDTRKTVPLLRSLQKYAVRCGGGFNHRLGLYDAAMLKDNHLAAAGSIAKAVEAFRRTSGHMVKLEVECETLEQVEEAVQARADVILLDNMAPATMREATSRHRGRAIFEASGGITLATVRAVAESGVDVVSVGALTHSAPALAFHMEFA